MEVDIGEVLPTFEVLCDTDFKVVVVIVQISEDGLIEVAADSFKGPAV